VKSSDDVSVFDHRRTRFGSGDGVRDRSFFGDEPVSSGMSSDDSGFDKEAEREKLREKYGDENEDRENTRRMSELLLQGATMTGKHCDNCGDPIFRHDGQEFCPTCQHEARAQAQNDEAGERPPSTENAQEADAQPDAAAQPDADQSTDEEPRVEINDVRVADQHADRSNMRRPPSQTNSDRRPFDDSNRRTHERVGDATDRDRDARERIQSRDHAYGQDRTRTRDHARAHGHHHSGDAGDLATAREALVRKLTDLARSAEETDDVARSRELLSATREAAEALAALDRANR
jgi:uncharacterized Zn finger protein (UPF0148 family)